MNSKLVKNAGFTLFEVIVTIAVTAIFFAIITTLIISINRNYRLTKKLNEMNNEVASVYQLINGIFDSYNLEGLALSFDAELNSVSAGEDEVISFLKNETLSINYKRQGQNEMTVVFHYIEDIEIATAGQLMHFTIIDKKGRNRFVSINIVGGIT